MDVRINIDCEDDAIIDPPDQASPKHILNALYNDCIQEIFKHFDDFIDIFNAAEVCTQFQANVRQYFPSIYRITFDYQKQQCQFDMRKKKMWKKSQLPLSYSRMQSILNIFGDSIECVRLVGYRASDLYSSPSSMELCRLQKRDENNFRMIADNCEKTVKELQFINSFINFEILSKFKALEKLEINDCRRVYFISDPRAGPFLNLKSLKLRKLVGDNGDWLRQTFPKLTEAEFKEVDMSYGNSLNKFVKRNPQLDRLAIEFRDIGGGNNSERNIDRKSFDYILFLICLVGHVELCIILFGLGKLSCISSLIGAVLLFMHFAKLKIWTSSA